LKNRKTFPSNSSEHIGWQGVSIEKNISLFMVFSAGIFTTDADGHRFAAPGLLCIIHCQLLIVIIPALLHDRISRRLGGIQEPPIIPSDRE
jgi:hypothetical protein